MRAGKHVHTVILDAETIPFVDVTAAEMLDRVASELDDVYPSVRAPVASAFVQRG
jgi:hypothetical protein